MALRIEKAFGVKMDTLLRMQTAYEIVETRSRQDELKISPYTRQRGVR
jgi:plasmid maintenance system antidote protein VapI